MLPVSLVPAGCQPWFPHCSDSSRPNVEGTTLYFAYASTLAVYIFHLDPQGNVQLIHVEAARFESHLSALAWHPLDSSRLLLSTAGAQPHLLQCQLQGTTFSIQQSLALSKDIGWLSISPQWPELFACLDGAGRILAGWLSPRFQVEYQWAGDAKAMPMACCDWNGKGNYPLLVCGDQRGSLYLLEFHGDGTAGSKFKVIKKKLDLVQQQSSMADEGSSQLDAISSVKWDPNSDSYLLVSDKNGRLLICDSASGTIISVFQRQGGGALAAMCWVRHIPGGFCTADSRSGIIRLWTVSQSSPIQIHKLLPSPIHGIVPLLASTATHSSSVANLIHLYLLTFADGSVGVFDLKTFSWVYFRHGGHTETIFGCDVLKPAGRDYTDHEYNPNLLATASYDGTVKIWDVGNSTADVSGYYFGRSADNVPVSPFGSSFAQTFQSGLNGLVVPKNIGSRNTPQPNSTGMSYFNSIDITLLDSFPTLGEGRRTETGGMSTTFGIWYTVSWASDGTYRLCAGSGRGHIVIYDARNARIVQRYMDLHAGAIYKVSWNTFPRNGENISGGLLASSSGDKTCLVFRPEDGKVIHRYQHPDEVFGCEWSPVKCNLLATSCTDGRVLVWDTADKRDAPIHTFLGHTSRAFNVAWSPLVSDWLASASDDMDIRVWSLSQNRCISVLKGHRKRVRGIVWNTEIAALLISGSWDFDIRIWDAKKGTCLQVISAHAADVYGLCSLSTNPLLLVSTSRDNTFRLWSIEDVVKTTIFDTVLAMAKEDWETACQCLFDNFDTPESASKLSGKRARYINKILKSPKESVPKKWKAVLDLVSPLPGTRELWKMALALGSDVDSKLTPDPTLMIRPKKDMLFHQETKAQKLDSVTLIQKIESGALKIPNAKTIPCFENTYSESGPNQSSSINTLTRQELRNLSKCAFIHLQMGHWKKYCDTLCALGEWERALAIAPVVGQEYWKKLLKKYCDFLNQVSQNDANQIDLDSEIPFFLANGDPGASIDRSLKVADVETAYTLALNAEDGVFDGKTAEILEAPKSLPPLSLETRQDSKTLPPLDRISDSLSPALPPLTIPNIPSPISKNNTRKDYVGRIVSFSTTPDPRDEVSAKTSASWKLLQKDTIGAISLLKKSETLVHALGLASVFDLKNEKQLLLKQLTEKQSIDS